MNVLMSDDIISFLMLNANSLCADCWLVIETFWATFLFLLAKNHVNHWRIQEEAPIINYDAFLY